MLKIIEDRKLPTEGIGGVGDVVKFGERRVTRHMTKAFYLPRYISRTEELGPFI